MKIQRLLEGAYDIHVHASPDVIPRFMDVIQIAKAAVEQKMSGLLFKDHTTSTTGRVYVLNHLLEGTCRFLAHWPLMRLWVLSIQRLLNLHCDPGPILSIFPHTGPKIAYMLLKIPYR